MSGLYKTIILKHYREPVGFGSVADMPVTASEENTSCGDRFRVGVDHRHGVIQRVAIEGRGCAVSIASCSMMAQLIEGMTISRARGCLDHVLSGLAGQSGLDADLVGDAAVFSELKRFPARRICASLCWKALRDALARI